jgi:hypothetical protein
MILASALQDSLSAKTCCSIPGDDPYCAGHAALAIGSRGYRALAVELDFGARPAGLKNSDVPRMALRRAVQVCNGLDALGDALNVDKESLQRWISGEEETPMPVFIQTVGLLLDATAARTPGGSTPDSSDGGRTDKRH